MYGRLNRSFLHKFWESDDGSFYILSALSISHIELLTRRASYYLSNENAQIIEKVETTLKDPVFKVERHTDEVTEIHSLRISTTIGTMIIRLNTI
jgi:hypothetical protein